MKYDHIKQAAYEANMELPKLGLVIFTFGNVSAADHDLGVFAIKPSGVPYENLSPDNMVIVDFAGNTVEGDMRRRRIPKRTPCFIRTGPKLVAFATRILPMVPRGRSRSAIFPSLVLRMLTTTLSIFPAPRQ